MFKMRLVFLFFLILSIFLFFHLELNQYLVPEYFVSKKQEVDLIYKKSPLLFILGFFFFYVFCATLSLPGAALLTLISGFLFDFFIAVGVVSLGSTFGAVGAFLLSRFFFKEFIQRKFHSRLEKINREFKKQGAFYVFSLRLIPVFPFFLVNVFMGLTPISLKHFFIASFLGMLPGSLVYVNAGSRLAEIQSFRDIISLPLILSFVLLASLSWIMKLFLKYTPIFSSYFKNAKH